MRGVIKHSRLGSVIVNFKTNAHRFIARRNYAGVVLTAPANADYDDIIKALDKLAPRLCALQAPDYVLFHDGQTIALDGLDIMIVGNKIHPDKIIVSQKSENCAYVLVGENLDYNDKQTISLISSALKAVARKNASRILLPHAKELALLHNCRPAGWQISSGSRILGQCSSEGVIKLSYMILFLPTELRDYVICHELAHLSEFNHSPRFHKLCDAYLCGREKGLKAQLKAYQWPLLRKKEI